MSEVVERIRRYIFNRKEVSMEDIYAVAGAHYERSVVTDALEAIHRQKDIEKRTRGDTVIYSIQRPRTRRTIDWRIPVEDYPLMDTSTNAEHPVFRDMDYSVLFMTPEERIAHEKDARDPTTT